MQGDPNPSNPVPVPLGSGQLAAYVDVYNAKLTPYGQQLDGFASATADEINRITTAGYDQNKNPGVALLQSGRRRPADQRDQHRGRHQPIRPRSRRGWPRPPPAR